MVAPLQAGISMSQMGAGAGAAGAGAAAGPLAIAAAIAAAIGYGTSSKFRKGTNKLVKKGWEGITNPFQHFGDGSEKDTLAPKLRPLGQGLLQGNDGQMDGPGNFLGPLLNSPMAQNSPLNKQANQQKQQQKKQQEEQQSPFDVFNSPAMRSAGGITPPNTVAGGYRPMAQAFDNTGDYGGGTYDLLARANYPTQGMSPNPGSDVFNPLGKLLRRRLMNG